MPHVSALGVTWLKQQADARPNVFTAVITCSDGRVRTLSALQALDEAGYTHIVGMSGGYNRFSQVFDSELFYFCELRFAFCSQPLTSRQVLAPSGSGRHEGG